MTFRPYSTYGIHPRYPREQPSFDSDSTNSSQSTEPSNHRAPPALLSQFLTQSLHNSNSTRYNDTLAYIIDREGDRREQETNEVVNPRFRHKVGVKKGQFDPVILDKNVKVK